MPDVSEVETVDQAVAVFETVGMPAKNLAARTRREYASDLHDLVAFLVRREITRLEAVGQRDLEAYLAELDRRGLKGSSRNRKTHTIKTFFKWLESQGILAVDPAARLVPPKVNKREPRFL